MQAIGDIISYFFPYYFICRAKKVQKSNWGKIYDIFPPVSSFFSLTPCNNCSTFTDGALGENMSRGKSNHTMFHKIMGSLEKNVGNREHNIIFFPYYFNFHTKKSTKINWGKIYDIFSPWVFIFFLLGHHRRCTGENILSLCVNVFPLCLCFPTGHAVW